MPKVIAIRNVVHPFDARYGTDTGGYIAPREPQGSYVPEAFGYGYSAVAPSVFRQACKHWLRTLSETRGRIEAFTFVDVGAGKGRALLLASELPFRRVVGIERSALLARIARSNIERWKRVGRPRAKIRVFQQDALEFAWPRAPLLLYLFNPFPCEQFARLLDRLEAAARSSSAADLLYVNPVCADLLSRRRRFSLLWTGRIDMDAPDRAGDPYGTSFDRVSAYRLRR
jgi:SAM-dependent methyltransferase